MLVLSWNLYHGRSQPPAGRELLGDFAALIASWEWDVALLQEVPPWWPRVLGAAAGASARTALTSRNLGLPVRRWVAERWPDLIKSNGGGANAILVRADSIAEHRRATLRRWPERRVVHGVRLASGAWVCNLHAQVHSEQRAQADMAAAGRHAVAWAASARAPIVLGGDTNTTHPRAQGFAVAGGHGVDHVLTRDLAAAGRARTLDRRAADGLHGVLSDHAPVLVGLHPD